MASGSVSYQILLRFIYTKLRSHNPGLSAEYTVLGSPQVSSLISSREYEKSGKIPLFSMLNFVSIFWILIANGGESFYLHIGLVALG